MVKAWTWHFSSFSHLLANQPTRITMLAHISAVPCNHDRCINKGCRCLDEQRRKKTTRDKACPPVFCHHGTILYGDLKKQETDCSCVHKSVVEQQENAPRNRDPMDDPAWSSHDEGSHHMMLGEQNRCPPSYCHHGKCVEGSEHGRSREWWSLYFLRK